MPTHALATLTTSTRQTNATIHAEAPAASTPLQTERRLHYRRLTTTRTGPNNSPTSLSTSSSWGCASRKSPRNRGQR
eukprot:9491024-Pyramimonas_sp.AAC.1